MNVAIIGAGLIGRKRAAALNKHDKLLVICDIDLKSAKNLASEYSCLHTDQIKDIVNNNQIDAVIISVINKYAAQLAINMLHSGKHVLCEKPLGITSKESKEVLTTAKNSGKIIKTGFNHRYHGAMMMAKKLLAQNRIGKILHIRSHYGHGGRLGMEQEWRCSKELCGGGELIDQGVHIIDLCRWFIGDDVKQVYGRTLTSFWQSNVEDNAFFHLEFDNSIIAQCHVSWTNWKNSFSFEIFGKKGFLKISGLGGSYGEELLEIGLRPPDGGFPEIEMYQFSDYDKSWVLEWNDFKDVINTNKYSAFSGVDGYAVNKVVEAIYNSNTLNKPVPVS